MTIGAILHTILLSAGTNAPATTEDDYVIAGAALPRSSAQQSLIIADRLGATGRPDAEARS